MSSLIVLETFLAISSITIGHTQGYTYGFAPPNLPLVAEGDNVTFHLWIQGITEDVLISVRSSKEDVFRIIGDTQIPIRTSDLATGLSMQNTSIPVTLKAIFIGSSTIEFDVQTREIFSESPYQITNYTVSSGTKAKALKVVSTYLLLAWLCLSYVTMGTTIKWSTMKPRIYRPQGIIIGIASQFVIMPLLSFLVAKVLGLESRAAVGLILVGTCPGGWLSNVYAALLNCDLVLSITMTFFSTVLALGLMPLNLHIYATPVIMGDEHLRTPFRDIIIQLASLVIPVFLGIFISYKFHGVGDKLQKLIKPIATFIILVSIAFAIPTNLHVLRTPASVWLAAAFLPMVGGLLGLFVAKVTCLPNRSAVTVALETGSQNSFLAISIASLSYKQPESDLIATTPILVAMWTLFEGSAILGIYLLMTKFPGRQYDSEEDPAVDEKDETKSNFKNFRKGIKLQGRKEGKENVQHHQVSHDETVHAGQGKWRSTPTSEPKFVNERKSRGIHACTQTDYEELLRIQPSYVNPAFVYSISGNLELNKRSSDIKHGHKTYV